MIDEVTKLSFSLVHAHVRRLSFVDNLFLMFIIESIIDGLTIRLLFNRMFSVLYYI